MNYPTNLKLNNYKSLDIYASLSYLQIHLAQKNTSRYTSSAIAFEALEATSMYPPRKASSREGLGVCSTQLYLIEQVAPMELYSFYRLIYYKHLVPLELYSTD